ASPLLRLRPAPPENRITDTGPREGVRRQDRLVGAPARPVSGPPLARPDGGVVGARTGFEGPEVRGHQSQLGRVRMGPSGHPGADMGLLLRGDAGAEATARPERRER